MGIPYEVRATQAEGFALYNCQQPLPTCTQVATLAGSMGTSGNVVTVSVPLSALGAGEGVPLSGLSAYTAFGTAAAGPGLMLDDVALPPVVIPTHSVLLGIAPSGTPESQVAISTPATVTNGNFSGNLPPVPAGSYKVWAKACLDNACGSAISTPLTVTDACAAPPVQLNAVVSRKVHGTAGTFDIDLPLTGSPGIECRSPGNTGDGSADYKLVFVFPDPLTSVGSVSSTATGPTQPGPSTGSIDADAHNYIVDLTAVPNAQYITVTLNNVRDTANRAGNVSQTVGILVGDTTADGTVNSADIGQTKSQSGHLVTISNFREDVTADGSINSADIGLVKSKSGTAWP
jgi:hypothetical protein